MGAILHDKSSERHRLSTIIHTLNIFTSLNLKLRKVKPNKRN